jgi:predicted ester cyclase
VAARWTIAGTQTGALGGIPPSGKAVIVSGAHVFRLVSGRIAEIWNHRNDLRLYQQIGALPPLPP